MKVAIIPARGGSKRIPRKNIRSFAGLPMMVHTILRAQESKLFDRIIVSTEDDEIALLAEKWGADAPFRRPADLSDDSTGIGAVMAHAVQWCMDQKWTLDYVCCLYATAPLLQVRYLREAFDTLVASRKSYCLPIASFPASIQRALKLTPAGLEMFEPDNFAKRSQDLTPAFHDAGQFCWGTAAAWLEGRKVFSHETTAIVLPRHVVQDIDTDEDWAFAEKLYSVISAT